MIKGSIQEEDVTFINAYAPNIGALNYIKQIFTNINGEIEKIIIRDFNNPLISMDRSFRQKINKKQRS